LKANANFLRVLAVLSTAIVVSSGCEDSYVFPNEAPSNLSIIKPSCYVTGGQEVALTATATDEDGDPIYYRWTTTAGSFDPEDGMGQTVTWTASNDPGPAVITLIVTDEIEESSLQTTIEIGGGFPVNIVTNEPLSDAVADSGYVYILNLQPVEIPAGMTFTIMEGVRMVARGTNSGFEVDGTLLIEGTEENPVTMGPDDCVPVAGSWAGIAFRSIGAAGTITYLQLHAADIGLLVTSGADIVISNSSLVNNSLYGIEVSDGGSAVVSGCTLWENQTGLYLRNGHLTLERSSLRYNEYAGVVMSAVNETFAPPITHCSVSSNAEYGFDIAGHIMPEIHYNAIFSNGIGAAVCGISLGAFQGADSIRAENNFWGLGYTTEEEVPALIYDAHDAPGVIEAYVGFIPVLTEMPPEVPNP
jgi:hypothetical protein